MRAKFGFQLCFAVVLLTFESKIEVDAVRNQGVEVLHEEESKIEAKEEPTKSSKSKKKVSTKDQLASLAKKATPTKEQRAAMKDKMASVAKTTKEQAAAMKVRMAAMAKAVTPTEEQRAAMKVKFLTIVNTTKKFALNGASAAHAKIQPALENALKKLKEGGQKAKTGMSEGYQNLKGKAQVNHKSVVTKWKAFFDQWRQPKKLVREPSAAFQEVDSVCEHDPNKVASMVWQGTVKAPCKKQAEIPLEEWVQSSYIAAEGAVGEGLVLAVMKIIEDSLTDEECPGRVVMRSQAQADEISLQAEAVAHAAVIEDDADDEATGEVIEEAMEIAAAMGQGGVEGLSDALEEECEEDPADLVEISSAKKDPKKKTKKKGGTNYVALAKKAGGWLWRNGGKEYAEKAKNEALEVAKKGVEDLANGDIDDPRKYAEEVMKLEAQKALNVGEDVAGQAVNAGAEYAVRKLENEIGGTAESLLEIEEYVVSDEAKAMADRVFEAGWIAACGEVPNVEQ